MNLNHKISSKQIMILIISISLFFCFSLAGSAYAQEKPTHQKMFSTPEKAMNTLITACKNNDSKAMKDLFGHNFEEKIQNKDKAQLKLNRMRFYEMATEKKAIEKKKDGEMIIVVGKMEYPFPIPIIKDKGGWRFDTPAGIEEITNRRIGENELITIAICHEYVKMQQEYARKDRDGDDVLEFAQKLISSKGKHDGLYWETDSAYGDNISPMGPLVAEAQDYLSIGDRKKSDPFYGYYYKILTKQGENAPGGKFSYIINGNMVAGFALVAYPANYGSTGIMTFIINSNGKLYQKDLGEKTDETVKKMDKFNPDKTWEVVKD